MDLLPMETAFKWWKVWDTRRRRRRPSRRSQPTLAAEAKWSSRVPSQWGTWRLPPVATLLLFRTFSGHRLHLRPHRAGAAYAYQRVRVPRAQRGPGPLDE